MGAGRAFALLVRAEFRVCLEPCQGVFNQDAAAGNGQPHFFIADVKAMVTPSAAASWVWLSSRGELLGKLRSSSFSFWVIGVCGWLEVDDIRGDGRAGEAVAFDVGGVG